MDFEEEPQAKTDHEQISISIVQQQGRFRRAIPCMPIVLAGLCCFFNVFIPGLGTLIAAFSVWCCSDPRSESRWKSFGTNSLAALLQLLTCPVIVGFVWSIIWGVLFIQIARKWFISSIDNRYSSVDCCPCARW
ncbi:unnamed protein product [Nippostrongylus brasiliensis]|uniref:Protein stum homolog (inferred by orthology to a human protein) n=1 Tax=Nippostrongylus brasiliensis TaxID=27835 RepID=A0A0N4Y8U9_NIPBR|nr:unnamed protein product [Nippostrongylus brasiliensis]